MKTLKPRVQALQTRLAPSSGTPRMTGRALQQRRERMWSANPHCAACGQITIWPHGFELDHIVRLADGGHDSEANVQILCVWHDQDGAKRGCHADKTVAEAANTG